MAGKRDKATPSAPQEPPAPVFHELEFANPGWKCVRPGCTFTTMDASHVRGAPQVCKAQ